LSFLSLLGGIGHIFKVFVGDAGAIAGVASSIPGVSSIPVVGTILGAIGFVDELISTANSGAQKKAVVTTIVNTVHPGMDQANLSASIDGIVAALNLLESEIAKIPAATPAAKT
jgi:hypothetical protein